MADSTVVHIGENSPEEVAFKLFSEIVTVEIHNAGGKMDRDWILNTYAQCLYAVRAPQGRAKA